MILCPNYGLSARLRLFANEHGFVYKDDMLYKIAETPEDADDILEIWERLNKKPPLSERP